MNWGLFLGLMLMPFYVGLVCWLSRPLQRYIRKHWPNSILLFSWRI
jgi:hypothetical protein